MLRDYLRHGMFIELLFNPAAKYLDVEFGDLNGIPDAIKHSPLFRADIFVVVIETSFVREN